MYALILNIVVAVALMICTANSDKYHPKRPSVNLKTIPCDRIEQSDVCRCCPRDPCDSITCFNGGKCVGDGVCECASGFGGPTCNMQVCNVTECNSSGRRCVGFKCFDPGNDCGGKQCNQTQVCVDDKCVPFLEQCFVRINGTLFFCVDKGGPCGGGFCGQNGEIICVGNTCGVQRSCNGSNDNTSCDLFGPAGTCSDGVCRVPCTRNNDCSTLLSCVGGFCVGPKCGESYCVD